MTGKRAAFSLLEAIVATFIFAVVAVFFVGIWATYAHSIDKASHHMVATYLGQKVLEETLGQGYANLRDTGPIVMPVRCGRKGQVITVEYDYSVKVTQIDPALKGILVTVHYPDKAERRELRFEAILYRNN
ncbi:MAG: hypothetical protein AB1758_07455 [Candidatus Eremiobacterota bacterium]